MIRLEDTKEPIFLAIPVNISTQERVGALAAQATDGAALHSKVTIAMKYPEIRDLLIMSPPYLWWIILSMEMVIRWRFTVWLFKEGIVVLTKAGLNQSP